MKILNPNEWNENIFELVGSEWCLIAATKDGHYNMMTASWGGMGVLWNKNVVTIYIRPQRYTKEFVDESNYFTLSFFDATYKKALGILGKESGRGMDKENFEGITGVISDHMVIFQEARITIKCKKIYQDNLKPEHFLDDSIDSFYPIKDYHDVYIGEIIEIIEHEAK